MGGAGGEGGFSFTMAPRDKAPRHYGSIWRIIGDDNDRSDDLQVAEEAKCFPFLHVLISAVQLHLHSHPPGPHTRDPAHRILPGRAQHGHLHEIRGKKRNGDIDECKRTEVARMARKELALRSGEGCGQNPENAYAGRWRIRKGGGWKTGSPERKSRCVSPFCAGRPPAIWPTRTVFGAAVLAAPFPEPHAAPAGPG